MDEICLSAELRKRLSGELNRIRWYLWTRGMQMGGPIRQYPVDDETLIEELRAYKRDIGEDWQMLNCQVLLDAVEAELEIGEWLDE